MILMSSAATLDSKIKNYIEYPNEERHLEFKGSIKWDGDIRAKITKSIMALANLRDGGWIVIGKEEKADRTFEITGMNQEDFDTFDTDEIKAYVYNRTDPPIDFNIHKKEYDGKKFILIEVKEFEKLPIICKKGFGNIIYAGKLYVRSKGKPESIAVPSSAEMEEVMEIAIDKGVEEYIQRASRVGLLVGIPTQLAEDNEEAFAQERDDLK